MTPPDTRMVIDGIASDVRGLITTQGEMREEFRVRLALSEADRRTIHAELDALRARVDLMALAPGDAALAGWRHVGVLALTAVASAALTGTAMFLKGTPH